MSKILRFFAKNQRFISKSERKSAKNRAKSYQNVNEKCKKVPQNPVGKNARKIKNSHLFSATLKKGISKSRRESHFFKYY